MSAKQSIFILLTNIFVKGSSIMYLYIGLFVSGGIGLLNGLLYFLKKYFKESERYFGRDFLHACYPQAHRQNTSD